MDDLLLLSGLSADASLTFPVGISRMGIGSGPTKTLRIEQATSQTHPFKTSVQVNFMALPTRDRAHFLLLKLHSLTGIFPIGAFLVLHLLVNSLRTVGVWQYQLSIDLINNLPFLIWVEILFIYIPLLVHSLMGFFIIFSGQVNVTRYPYQRNWGYSLQRITGAVVFFFLIYHLGTTVGPKIIYGKEQFEAAPFLIDIMNSEFKTWGGRALYLIGIVSAAYHFCMGLWGFCVSWGILIGREAQRNAGIVFAVFGLALTVLGVATVVEFSLDPAPVQATVERIPS